MLVLAIVRKVAEIHYNLPIIFEAISIQTFPSSSQETSASSCLSLASSKDVGPVTLAHFVLKYE